MRHKIISIAATTAFATLLTVGAVFATSTISDDITVGDDLTVTGLATVGETLGVTGATTLTGALTANGSVTLGDAIADTTIIKSRIATGTVAGSAINTGAAYAYGEGVELRYAVDDWTLIPSTNFKGYYFRTEATTGNAAGQIRGMEVYSVANIASGTTGLASLTGLYSELLVKLPATSYTIAGYPNAIEANFSFDQNSGGTTTITNGVAALVAKIQTANGLNSYTNLDGIRIIGRDADSARTMGDGLVIENDAVGSNATWTKAISVTAPSTTAISLAGTMTTGIGIGTTTTTGISFTGGSATLINANAAAAHASTRGIFIGEDANVTGSAIPLNGGDWATAQGNAIYCEDGGTALTSYTECLTTRMLTTAAVTTGDVSTVAFHPDLTINADYAGTGGLASIWGNTTIMTGKTVNLAGSLGDVAGGTFGVDIVGTLAADSHAAGVSVGVGGSGTKTGILSGFRIRGATGTVDWDAILSIEDGDGSWTSMTKPSASATATMTTAPKAGEPAYWLKIYIGETEYYFPVWTD